MCDVVFAGSADASLFPAVIGSFQRLGVLAKVEDDPGTACRPFDRHRSGFLIGEGAACLVFERTSHAAARGQRWYGEWLGGRLASDPSGLTQCDPDGRSLTRVLSDLLRQIPVPPDYLNLHGTGTRRNDAAECRAIRTALGSHAEQVSCSGSKGSLGHLLGAAGSVELALTLLALRDQIVPPTMNLTSPDPDCRLNLTPSVPQRRQMQTAIKISSGFGGHLAVAAVGRGHVSSLTR
jgi:3-oxoacyl-[acyl-carrier-protein] synthase II